MPVMSTRSSAAAAAGASEAADMGAFPYQKRSEFKASENGICAVSTRTSCYRTRSEFRPRKRPTRKTPRPGRPRKKARPRPPPRRPHRQVQPRKPKAAKPRERAQLKKRNTCRALRACPGAAGEKKPAQARTGAGKLQHRVFTGLGLLAGGQDCDLIHTVFAPCEGSCFHYFP